MTSQMKKAATMNKCASDMGHFDNHDNAPVQWRVHRPTKHAQGYLKATGYRHRVIIRPVLPWRTPWSSILA